MNGREQQAERTKNALLIAAAEEFSLRGLNGARVQEIVSRSRINERMIYHHFESKEGLYLATVDREKKAVEKSWEPYLRRAGGLAPREGLTLALLAYMGIARKRSAFLRLAMQQAMTGWDSMPEAKLANAAPQLRTIFEKGVQDGVFRSDVSFDVFYVAAMGALNWQALFGRRFSDLRQQGQAKRMSELVVELILDGLAS